MTDYYDQKFAFFPDNLNSDRRKYLNLYLLEPTEQKVRSHSEIVGNPDTIPRSLYRLSAALGKPMKVRRTDKPGVVVDGTVRQIFLL